MIKLSDILVFLLISVLVSIFSKKTNTSPVIGFLVGGIIVGPFLGNILGNTETIDFFSDMGVIFLLFMIGLHLPIEKIKTIQIYVFGFGTAQVILTTIFYSIVSSLFLGTDKVASILLGFVVSLSSTALILKILEDCGDLATDYGKASFGTLLFQDLAAVVVMTLLPIAGGNNNTSLLTAIISLVKSIVALSIAIFVAKYILKPIYKWAAENGSQVFMSITLIAIFGTSSITNFIGISTELGAFLAGILMAGSEYRLQIEADIEPFKELLMGLFFVTVGSSINFDILEQNKTLIAEIILSMLFCKALVIMLISKFIKHSIANSIKSAFLMSGGGEFAFVMFVPISDAGLVPNDKIGLFSLAISITMAITPLLAAIGKLIAEKIELKTIAKEATDSKVSSKDLSNHVLIIGFGRVGQTIANLLAQHLIPYIAIDSNMNRVIQAKAKSLPVFYGEAKRREIYRILGAHKAKMAVIAIGKPSNSEKAAFMLIQNFPKLKIWLRSNDSEKVSELEKFGINVIVPELLEPSLQLAKAILKASGINSEDAEQSVIKYRSKHNIQNISSTVEEVK